jgi:hypothetical protein
MTESLLDQSPVWLLYALTVAWLFAGSEVGFRLGGISKSRVPEPGKASVGTVVGSTLGLLAFLLAFTFGMSSTRFDARKQLVLEEASALLVTYQRAQSLPEPQRTECSRLLREYIQLRMNLPSLESIAEIMDGVRRSEDLQDELWAQAAILSEKPNAIVSGFVQSLAVLSDLQIKRIRSAVWNRIPTIIIGALYGIGFLALTAVGFNAGLNAYRPTIPAVALALAFSIIIVLIIDLERPHQRLFHVSQEPIIDVARRIDSPVP